MPYIVLFLNAEFIYSTGSYQCQGLAGPYFKYHGEQEPIIAEIYITPHFGSFCLDISFFFSPVLIKNIV